MDLVLILGLFLSLVNQRLFPTSGAPSLDIPVFKEILHVHVDTPKVCNNSRNRNRVISDGTHRSSERHSKYII